MTAETIAGRLRRFLLLMTTVSFLVVLVELVLEEHTKETLQFVPFALCAIGLIAVTAVLVRPLGSTLLALRVSMVIVALGGFVNIAVHLLENVSFEQEIRPNATTNAVIGEAIKGAAPLLAPGALIFAAMLALATTYYHPALAKSSGS
jgi:hypothetical protein